MNLEHSEEKLNKLKTEFPNIPEVFIKRVLRCHDLAENPESLEIVRKELRGFQGIQTPQGRGGVFKKRPSAGQREVLKGGSIAECGGDLAGRHVGDQKRTDDATQEECRAKIDDEVMELEYSEETLNKLKAEFPNIPEVFIKRVLRCHGVATNPENLEIVRKELRGFQGTQTPLGRGGVFKKQLSAEQREVPIGRSIAECGGDLAGRHVGDQKRTDDATQEECRAKIDDEVMKLEYSEETLNKLKTEFPNIPEVFIKRVLRCHGVAANPENLESARKELRGFQDIQAPQGRGEVFKKRPRVGQREVPIGGSKGECDGDLAGRHLSDQKSTNDATQEECRAKIDGEIMKLEYSEETLNKLKTEFPNIPEVFIKRVLRCHDVAANPENLESARKELREFRDIQTPQGRGGVFKKQPSGGQREVPIGGSLDECGEDLAGRHLSDQKRRDDAIQEECRSICADDEFGPQLPVLPRNLNRFGDPPPNKPKSWQGPTRKAQDISTKNQGEYEGCPSERGTYKDNYQGVYDDLRVIVTQLANSWVKIAENGTVEEDFVFSGNKVGVERALNTIVASVTCKTIDIKQPGLKKFYASGKGDLLEKSIEKNYECAIHVQKSFDSKREEGKVQGTQAGSDSTSSDDDDDPVTSGDDDNDDEWEAVVSETDRSSFATEAGHQVSWRAGIIEAEKVDILVSSQGACSQAILTAGGWAMRKRVTTPNIGQITVTPGFALPCSYVIHTNCSPWNEGISELVLRDIVKMCLQKGEALRMSSIAFPVIGTGKLKFPPSQASRIMLEEVFSFCQTNDLSSLTDIRFVVYQQDQALITAFKQEMANLQSKHNLRQEYTTSGFFGKFQSKFGIRTAASSPGLSSEHGLVGPSNRKYTGPSIEVINADLTQETTDAILNINSSDMNMNNAGELSKAILKQGGSQIQQECSQLGNQIAGSAVMTSGGNLAARKVIHIIPESKDKRHLQTCLEAGLRLADKHKLRSLSLPCAGTGAYCLSAADSAQVTFQALNNFNLSCQWVRKVRIVVFKASMMQEFLQAHQRHSAREADHKLDSDSSSGHTRQLKEVDRGLSLTNDSSIKICVAGKDATSVEKAVDSLKSGFSEACTTQKVENEAVNQLSHRQIDSLRKKANDRDVRLDIEADIDRIVVRGEPIEVTGMVGEIWHELNERNKKIKEEQQALLVSKNIEWSYEIHGAKMVFGSKTNAKLEMAHVKSEAFVRVSLRGDEFDINMKAKTGQGRYNGETITIHRKVKGSAEGFPLPEHWDPMPSGKTVLLVPVLPDSSEYRCVASKVSLTTLAVNIQRIERIQNPHLYQSYVVRKQKIDQDNGGNNERQLFHGTKGENVKAINTQGFNRRFCGQNGVIYGQGVYFARDASYSVQYATGGAGSRYMYLARVLVGQYCVGNSAMKNPPPKDTKRPEILYDSVVNDTSNPSIFVVFHDTQYYPEYLITF